MGRPQEADKGGNGGRDNGLTTDIGGPGRCRTVAGSSSIGDNLVEAGPLVTAR